MTLNLKKILLLCTGLFISMSAMSEGLADLPTKTISGKTYYYYKVQPKETVYSLCRRFGVSREYFMQTNPSAADGLKIDQMLLFPADGAPQPESIAKPVPSSHSVGATPPEGTIAYTVQRKETAYGISKKFGMTLDEFYALNPDARDYGVKADQQVFVRSGNTVRPAEPQPAHERQQTGEYEVRRGDTFYSIARSHGLSAEQLQAANPAVSVLVPGQFINIPQGCDERIPGEEPTVTEPHRDVTLGNRDWARNGGISMAVVLPFMLEQQPRSRQANLYTEFYKGLLLAVDSMRNCGTPIKVLTYDTKGTMEGIEAVMADPALASAQVIIGPDNVGQVETLARYALDNGSSLLNIFAVKDESYVTMPNVMNSIVPHATMYEKAVKYLVDNSDGYTPVILNRIDGQQDKDEFVNLLKQELNAAGRQYFVVDFEKKLTEIDLADFAKDKKYAFIPMSSKLVELKAVLPELSTFAQTFSQPDGVCLWGYPEWLSFRGDPLNGMYKLNTVIFSRFYNTGETDADTKRINELYSDWYGGSMINVIPSQGLYGFDTGMYLIKALMTNNGDFGNYTPVYDGVQNCFNFVRGNDVRGWVNNEMFIIRYTPDKSVVKLSL